MKFSISFTLCFVPLLAVQIGRTQGTFQNLGFESANIPANAGTFIPFTNALPAWSGSLGPFAASDALYNGISGAFADISIIDRGSSSYSNSVIAGNYTAAISAGFAGTGFVSTAIAQTGLAPSTAQSLRFAAQPFSGNIGALQVTFAGQSIPFVQIASGPNFAVYGGDISALAGMTGELRFTEIPTSTVVATTVLLDSIQFSDQPIPEPRVTGLSVLGALVFCWRQFRSYKKPRNNPCKYPNSG